MATLSEVFVYGTPANDSCFFDENLRCDYKYVTCETTSQATVQCLNTPGSGYSDANATFVLLCAIIVFFMKAGFMLVEYAFAETDEEKRQIIIMKNTDTFASAFGFFLIGCDFVAGIVAHDYPVDRAPFQVQEPLLWFFKFTFASNAATLIGGCLINFKYKLRLPVAFLSAFVISGILHPLVSRFIWGAKSIDFLSPFRFCHKSWRHQFEGSNFTCNETDLFSRLYAVDYAGGGVVHLLGGVIGLQLCLFAKFAARKDENTQQITKMKKKGFFEWMYPISGGSEENIEKAALGVLILWFGWFAFNCGSTESIAGGYEGYSHSVPGRIAVNMILCCASGGTLAVIIASWAQVRYRAATVNANEIANNVLSCLVAISSSCPMLQYYQASLVGILAVVLYHFGCFIEYRFRIPDTARVFPVHAVCGLLGMLVVPIAAINFNGQCLLHGAFESVLWCSLRLPKLTFWELLLGQVLAISLIILVGLLIIPLYLIPYCIPVKRLSGWLTTGLLLNYKNKREPLVFAGNLLFSGPEERETAISSSPETASGSDSDNVRKDTPQPSSFTLKSARNRDGTLSDPHSLSLGGQQSHSQNQQAAHVEIHHEMTRLSEVTPDILESIEELEESSLLN